VSLLSKTAAALSGWTTRWVPGAFSIASILTALVLVLGLTLGRAGPVEVVRAWGDGVWVLLTFGMQMCLIVFCGYLVAVSRPARWVLGAVAGLPRSPRQAVALVAAASMALCWVHWGMGLITAAVLVAYVAERQPRADFRLLVAAAYLGLGATWHAGPSGSVPLLLATPDNFLIEEGILSATLPLGQTIFTAQNLGFVAVVTVALTVLAAAMHPAPGQEVSIAPEAARALVPLPEVAAAERSPAGWVEHSVLPNAVVGVLGLLWVVAELAGGTFALDLDSLNLVFLCLAVLLHGTPASLAAAVGSAARPLHGIVLQFPLYAGMFGVIKGTDLAARAADALVALSTPSTYPVLVAWYSGALNYFVPSGGSKWAIEAPYLLDAATRPASSSARCSGTWRCSSWPTRRWRRPTWPGCSDTPRPAWPVRRQSSAASGRAPW